MSIYDEPKKYAEVTGMTLEQAEIRCSHYKQAEEKVHEARKCPKCGAHTLIIEGGSYEENTSDYVLCDNEEAPFVDEAGKTHLTDCGFMGDIGEKYKLLTSHCDFDVVLAFAMDIERDGREKVEALIGSSWTAFVEDSNKGLTLSPST